MRRSSELECIKKESELSLRFFLANTHDLEDAILDVTSVNTNRATADFITIADNVIGVGQSIAGILVESIQPFRLWRGEGVVNRSPSAVSKSNVTFGLGLSGRLEERCVDNPGKCPRIRIDQVAALTDLKAGSAKQLARCGGLTSSEENAVTGLGASGLGEASALSFGNVLCNRAAKGAFFIKSDVSQALGATRLGPFLPLIKGTTRLRTATGHDDSTDVGCLEDSERRVLEVVGQVNKLISETKIRLIRAVLFHRVLVRHARNRGLEIVTDEGPDILQDLFCNGDDVVLVDEAHLNIKLGELRLTIRTEVFVTIAACNLEVAFHSGNHQHLLEKLRRLR